VWSVRAGAGISLHMKKDDIIKDSYWAGSYDFPSNELDPMSFFYGSVQYPMFPVFKTHFYGFNSFLPLVPQKFNFSPHSSVIICIKLEFLF
jgi:hypothetical protein